MVLRYEVVKECLIRLNSVNFNKVGECRCNGK